MAHKLTALFVALAAFTLMLCISEVNSVPEDSGILPPILPKKCRCNILDLLYGLINICIGNLNGTITNLLDAVLELVARLLCITLDDLRKLLPNISIKITLEILLVCIGDLIQACKENTGNDLVRAVIKIIAGLLGIDVTLLLPLINLDIYICPEAVY